jgi:hypothetical protein
MSDGPPGRVITESNKYRAEWADPPDIRQWLSRELFAGDVLNMCCGDSPLGDVQADMDEDRNPDVVADLENPETWPWDEREFDTVYCDPPFGMFNPLGDWYEELWKLADQRLILQTPRTRVPIKSAEKDFYVCEPQPGDSGFRFHIFQVFDRVAGLERWTE